MSLLRVVFAFALASASALGAAFLSAAWRKRRKQEPEEARIEACLPGHDCGLCGRASCRDYAAAVDSEGLDPGLCAPGGEQAEDAVRSILSERKGDSRASRLCAAIRCGGGEGRALAAFDYEGRDDCASAAALYGGPLVCKDGCIGFGSCAAACPLGAIEVKAGLAVVDARLCSGCGLCVPACPKGLIALLPADQSFFVACSSRAAPERRRALCSASCDACGECARRAMLGEFVVAAGMASARRVDPALGAEIALHCPAGAIRAAAAKKKPAAPSGNP